MALVSHETTRLQSIRRFVILALVSAVIHLMFVANLGAASGLINLPLVVSACLAFSLGGPPAVLVGFFSGLFFDLTTTGPIGLMALLLSLSSWALGLAASERFAQSGQPAVRQFLLADCVVSILYNLAMLVVSGPSSLFGLILFKIVPSILLSFVAFLVSRAVLMRGGHVRGLSGQLPRDGSSKHFDTSSN
ncbi:MAG: rod shape-determining protein MreD [Atopobiaceae bacterium]|nr:rod shape-determining protein MreD [Atopobiaceae bacterium]